MGTAVDLLCLIQSCAYEQHYDQIAYRKVRMEIEPPEIAILQHIRVSSPTDR